MATKPVSSKNRGFSAFKLTLKFSARRLLGLVILEEMAISAAVLRMHLLFHVVLMDANFTAGPHVRRELRANPMLLRIRRNAIQI